MSIVGILIYANFLGKEKNETDRSKRIEVITPERPPAMSCEKTIVFNEMRQSSKKVENLNFLTTA